MKKQILRFGIIASLLFPTLAFTQAIQLPSNHPEQSVDLTTLEGVIDEVSADLHPDVHADEGGQLFLCFPGNADQLQQTARVTIEGDSHWASTPLNPFVGDNGSRSFAIKNLKENAGIITNSESQISFLNIRARNTSTGEQGQSIKNIFGPEGETPYMDYIAAGRDAKPCDPKRAVYGKIIINKDSNWVVAQLFDTHPESPAADVPVAPPPAAPEGQGNEFSQDVSPSSGGCSLDSAGAGANFTLMIFSALTLGAHALFRFRRQ